MFRQVTFGSALGKLLLYVLLIMLFVAIFLYLNDIDISTSLSFIPLFEKITSLDSIDASSVQLFFNTGITGDWGVFAFLQDFLNSVWQIIGFVAYVAVSIVNVMYYVFQVLKVLFVGVLG